MLLLVHLDARLLLQFWLKTRCLHLPCSVRTSLVTLVNQRGGVLVHGRPTCLVRMDWLALQMVRRAGHLVFTALRSLRFRTTSSRRPSHISLARASTRRRHLRGTMTPQPPLLLAPTTPTLQPPSARGLIALSTSNMATPFLTNHVTELCAAAAANAAAAATQSPPPPPFPTPPPSPPLPPPPLLAPPQPLVLLHHPCPLHHPCGARTLLSNSVDTHAVHTDATAPRVVSATGTAVPHAPSISVPPVPYTPPLQLA
jgi:hypothetical protein